MQRYTVSEVGASQDVPTNHYALSFDINWVTVAQVSRSHSPVFDMAVRQKYICRM